MTVNPFFTYFLDCPLCGNEWDQEKILFLEHSRCQCGLLPMDKINIPYLKYKAYPRRVQKLLSTYRIYWSIYEGSCNILLNEFPFTTIFKCSLKDIPFNITEEKLKALIMFL